MALTTQTKGDANLKPRPVSLFHHKLETLAKISKGMADLLAIQGIDHLGVQVANYDPNTLKMTRVDCYGLRRRNGRVGVKYEQFPVSQYKEPKFLFLKAIKGTTSKSDEEIRAIAEQKILEHGDYVLGTNDCRRWAFDLFQAICDLEGNIWKDWNVRFAKIQSKKFSLATYAGVAGGLFVLALVAEKVLDNLPDDDEEEEEGG